MINPHLVQVLDYYNKTVLNGLRMLAPKPQSVLEVVMMASIWSAKNQWKRDSKHSKPVKSEPAATPLVLSDYYY
jgi:hypothetical protein